MSTRHLTAILLGSTALAIASNARADSADASTDASNDTTVGSVTVIAAPREEIKARVTQAEAPVIVNVQSAETILKYPDYNAAEALGRMPGISLSTDTGEGRFVNIRGIDANLNGATFGGVVLLNTFAAGTAASGSGRAVEFDTIPTGSIDGIIVYKTLSPDREAEGLGGQIELTPRSAKNIAQPFLEGQIGWGYENLHEHTGPVTADLAAGVRFGFNSGHLVIAGSGEEPATGSGWISNPTPFSFVFAISRKDDQRGVDDTEPSYANDGAPFTRPDGSIGATCGGLQQTGVCDHVLGRVDFRRYDYHRRRFGWGGEFDFKPNDDHSYYLRLDVAGYRERAHKNHWYAAFDGAPSAQDAQGFVVDGFQPQVDLVDLEETHRNTVFTVGGEDNIGNWKVDYRAAYSRATYVESYYNEARFFGTDTFTGRYNDTADSGRFFYQFFNDPAMTVPFDSTNVNNYFDPASPAARLTRFFEADADQEYSYVANATYPVQLFTADGAVKFGVSARLRDKVVNDFQAFGSAAVPLSSISQSVGPTPLYYYGWYPPAPYADINKMNALVRAALPTFSQSLGRDFKDRENVYAGYGMYTGNIGRWGLLAGVRVEATDATYGNFLTTTDINGNSTVSFVNHSNSYLNVFPTVQLKYTITPQLQVRATYSTGIARPGFSQAGGNAGVDFTTSPRPQLTAGNPNLKATTGNNFDLDIEYYTADGGILEAGVFDKEFSNYIFRTGKVNVLDPIFLGQRGDIFTFDNESAYARGVELAVHQRFVTLPGWWSGFGVEGNVTYVDSKFREYSAAVAGQGKDEFGTLPGTSRLTWNAAGFYEKNGLAVRLSAEYVSASLFSLNGDQTLDTIQHEKLNLDFTSIYDVSKQFSVYFNVKNLLDTPLRYDDGNSTRPQQIEYYGQTYEAGVRFHF